MGRFEILIQEIRSANQYEKEKGFLGISRETEPLQSSVNQLLAFWYF